jgi:hypothetical protein
MKISKVIAELAKVMAEYGDLETVTNEWGGASTVEVFSVYAMGRNGGRIGLEEDPEDYDRYDKLKCFIG